MDSSIHQEIKKIAAQKNLLQYNCDSKENILLNTKRIVQMKCRLDN